MRRISAIFLFIVFFAVFAVFIRPFINLNEGSFLESVLTPLNSIAQKYAGFFPHGRFSAFTLLPVVLFFFFIFIDVACKVKIGILFSKFLLLLSLYFISFSIYGSQEYYLFTIIPEVFAVNALYFGMGFCILAFITFIVSLVFSIKKSMNIQKTKEKTKKKKIYSEDVKEPLQSSSNENISYNEARNSLSGVKIPVFTNYRNINESDVTDAYGNIINRGFYSAAYKDGSIHRQIYNEREEERLLNQQKIDEVFRPRNLQRKLEEESKASFNMPIFDPTKNFDIHNPPVVANATTSVSPQQSNVVYVNQQPAPQPQVIYPQVIVVRSDKDGETHVSMQDSQTGNTKNPGRNDSDKINSTMVNNNFVSNFDEGNSEEKSSFRKNNQSANNQSSNNQSFAAMREQIKSNPSYIDHSKSKLIVDEGTDSEDVFARVAFYKMKDGENDQDNEENFVSGVGGLKRSSDGYLYNAEKFNWKFPPETFLKRYGESRSYEGDIENDENGRIIVQTLKDFNIETNLIHIQHGPTFTLYELVLARGIRINAVVNLSKNIGYDLGVDNVRILAPIPGKSAIGVEVPNKKRETIGFESLLYSLKKQVLRIPMVLGKTIMGDSVIIDLAGAPHLLIAGTTGSGKSVCVNSLICSVLFTKTPKEVRMMLIDPKMVELSVYNGISHLLTPVITDPKKAIKAIVYCIDEMERRMKMFNQMNVRNIEDYNKKISEKNILREKIPYIMVIIDEFADLMMVVGKELENYIKRITQLARFTGIHLVLATQRPSVDVITGTIKSNMPSTIAFAVSNQTNSRIILDEGGAEMLLGKGDMLYSSATNPKPKRIQGAYIDTDEIDRIVEFIKAQGKPDYIDESYFEDKDDEENDSLNSEADIDNSEDLFKKAWRILYDHGEASASWLQRKLGIGYPKAASIMDQLEEQGIIGPSRGSKPREVLRNPDSV